MTYRPLLDETPLIGKGETTMPTKLCKPPTPKRHFEMRALCPEIIASLAITDAESRANKPVGDRDRDWFINQAETWVRWFHANNRQSPCLNTLSNSTTLLGTTFYRSGHGVFEKNQSDATRFDTYQEALFHITAFLADFVLGEPVRFAFCQHRIKPLAREVMKHPYST